VINTSSTGVGAESGPGTEHEPLVSGAQRLEGRLPRWCDLSQDFVGGEGHVGDVQRREQVAAGRRLGAGVGDR